MAVLCHLLMNETIGLCFMTLSIKGLIVETEKNQLKGDGQTGCKFPKVLIIHIAY